MGSSGVGRSLKVGGKRNTSGGGGVPFAIGQIRAGGGGGGGDSPCNVS